MALKMYGEKKTPASSIRYTIGIAAGKGGVGKSSLTVNLGLALQELGYRVGILDADLYGPSIRKMLPEDKLPLQNGEKIVPAYSQGIALMSIAFFREKGQASIIRAPIANGMITQFIEQVSWGELDFLLIDFPPGTGDIQITLSQKGHLTGALIVTTPQEVAVLDVRKCIAMFEQVKIPLVGIVENMSYYQPEGRDKVYLFGKGGGEKLAIEVAAPFLGSIPIDPLIGQCLDQGISLYKKVEAKPLQDCFLHLAHEVERQCQEIQAATPFIIEWKEMELKTSLNNVLRDAGQAVFNFFRKKAAADKVSIQTIIQKDNQTFTIEWNDGVKSDFGLAKLQANCPCAACVEKTAPLQELKDVRAYRIRSIGRYAIKIDFTKGCSNGIYDFEHLRAYAKDKL